MIEKEIIQTASHCRHCSMCKIDFLQTGLCSAGAQNHFVSYYPMGRMDILHALAESRIPVTERLVDIAETCTLCGICDKQCYFITEMRPMKVMQALKEAVNTHVKAGKEIVRPQSDLVLDRLRGIVGERWATNDPAILTCYSHDTGIFTGVQTPKYVAMPLSQVEVSSVVTICNQHQIPYVVRGNGSTEGLVYARDGLVIDMGRMKGTVLNKANWFTSVEAGVSAFELQKEAAKNGLRVNVAEPEALVCANLMTTGILSPFSASYGVGASNYVNAQFVALDGELFDLNQRDAPNLYACQNEPMPSPGICTRADLKVYAKMDDEDGVLIPFSEFHEALFFARELGQRRIGIGITVLNPEYMATFVAPTKALGEHIKRAFTEDLGIEYAVLVLGDKYALKAVRTMTDHVIDSELMRTLLLGMPNMVKEEWRDLLGGLKGDRPTYELMVRPEMQSLIETVLNPSPELLAQTVDPDLKGFFVKLYARPEMTNLIWLNMFRIISPRMARSKCFVPFLIYLPFDDIDLIDEVKGEFNRIANSNALTNDYGWLSPLDFGKRAVLEYDYYYDAWEPMDVNRARQAVQEAAEMIEHFRRADSRIKSVLDLFNQGFSRMESLLYM